MGSRLLVVCWLCGCNQALGLDATMLPPPDEDRDGIADADDGCPTVPDPDQRDDDGDGFGDACDRCPGLATARNHDEDGDRRGDDCDLCPIAPDFGEDFDGDGVGDLCEFVTTSAPTRLLWFDPFVALEPALRTEGGAWASGDDAIAPVAPPATDDPGLVLDAFDLTATLFSVEVGAVSARPWVEGDQAGVSVVDAEGTVASCRLTCVATTCELALRVRSGYLGATRIEPRPVLAFQLRQMGAERVACLAGGVAISGVSAPIAGKVVLHGAPAIALTSLGVWGEDPPAAREAPP